MYAHTILVGEPFRLDVYEGQSQGKAWVKGVWTIRISRFSNGNWQNDYFRCVSYADDVISKIRVAIEKKATIIMEGRPEVEKYKSKDDDKPVNYVNFKIFRVTPIKHWDLTSDKQTQLQVDVCTMDDDTPF